MISIPARWLGRVVLRVGAAPAPMRRQAFDLAGGLPSLSYLGNLDECVALLHPFPVASVGDVYRRRLWLHLAGYRSKAAKTALSPFI